MYDENLRGWADPLEPTPGVAKPDPLLVCEGIARRFGGLLAVDVDHLEVQREGITALIGPNGAGKTTFFNVITGFDRHDRGVWRLDGQDVSGWRAHRIASGGMVRTFQLTKALARMSVLDNMLVGARADRGERMLMAPFARVWADDDLADTDRARALLDQFQLAHMADEYAATLSGGQRKLLEMARAMMAQPTMILLDEPMAGVNPALVHSLLERVVELRDDGVTVLFIEHDMDVVMGISDWVVCMAEGRVIAEGRPDAVASNSVVIDAYLGTRARREDVS